MWFDRKVAEAYSLALIRRERLERGQMLKQLRESRINSRCAWERYRYLRKAESRRPTPDDRSAS